MASFLLGPVYDPPTGLLISDALIAWSSQLSGNLTQVLQTGQSAFGDFEANTSSVSITIVSTQDAEDAPFFDFHYASPFLNDSDGGTNSVTKNSIYRIGSISKLVTAYALLVGYGWESWDHPVTQYIPELRVGASDGAGDPVEDASWDEITIGALASHLSGIGRDCK
ncbi:putative beta-lactamase transpeptidase-like [Rosellinia necatrix]|uniref:Putative beta-lactamase transpeptidase-like n=1 Tax=Rosellinia necatrix TaxID=77044 RepID=A0A1S8A9S0_ROSNE|nr:putative beta-lactamase transpeptidase-like [Rosellinia necatrix]